MRKTFYDLLSDFEFNVLNEYEKLLYLFERENSIPMNGYLKPLSEYINKYLFREFKHRGSFTSLYAMMDALNLHCASDNLDDLLIFCEFLLAVMPTNVDRNYKYRQCNTIKMNIDNILEKTNHHIIRHEVYEDSYIIVEKNKAASLAAQVVQDKGISFELLEYNHYALKGDLLNKRKILASIGTYIEPYLKEKILSTAGYKTLESNVGFLLNKFHIRHNNKEGKTAQDYILSLNDEELELWYDRTYDVLIQTILTNENISVEKDIEQLKKDYKWK